MKLNYPKIFSLILVSVCISLIYNHFNPSGLTLIREKRILEWKSDSTDFSPIDTNKVSILENKIANDTDRVLVKKSEIIVESFSEPKAIKIDFAYKLFKQGVKFIDARSVEEYTQGHIKGAINIPFYGSENFESMLNKISQDEFIITYCSGEDCDLSILLGDELFQKGYKKVYVFFGGWNDWLKKGYPVEK